MNEFLKNVHYINLSIQVACNIKIEKLASYIENVLERNVTEICYFVLSRVSQIGHLRFITVKVRVNKIDCSKMFKNSNDRNKFCNDTHTHTHILRVLKSSSNTLPQIKIVRAKHQNFLEKC